MTPAGTTPRATYSPLLFVGMGLSLLLLFWATRRLSWEEIHSTLSLIEVWPWLPLAVLLYLTGHIMRGFRCRLLVSRETTLPLATASNIVALGYAVNNILPARMGELARAGLLSERTGVPFPYSLSVTFLERLFDGLTILALLGVTSLAVGADTWINDSFFLVLGLFASVSLAVGLAVVRPQFMLGFVSRLTHRLPSSVHRRVLNLAIQVVSALTYLRSGRALARISMLSLGVWLLETGMFLAILPAFGLEANLGWALLAMSVTNLGILLPSSPGFIGPFHFFCTQTLVSLGVLTATAFSYAVVVHLTFYLPITLWGVGVLFWYGVKLGRTLTLSRKAKEAVINPEDGTYLLPAAGLTKPPQSDLLAPARAAALCEALTADDSLMLAAADRAQVLQDVSRFIREQMNSLPLKLRILFSVGMLGFDTYAILRYQHTFGRLPAALQKRIVSDWSYGWFRPARMLFRPLRSTALLAFYDHPLVQLGLDRQTAMTEPLQPAEGDGP